MGTYALQAQGLDAQINNAWQIFTDNAEIPVTQLIAGYSNAKETDQSAPGKALKFLDGKIGAGGSSGSMEYKDYPVASPAFWTQIEKIVGDAEYDGDEIDKQTIFLVAAKWWYYRLCAIIIHVDGFASAEGVQVQGAGEQYLLTRAQQGPQKFFFPPKVALEAAKYLRKAVDISRGNEPLEAGMNMKAPFLYDKMVNAIWPKYKNKPGVKTLDALKRLPQ